MSSGARSMPWAPLAPAVALCVCLFLVIGGCFEAAFEGPITTAFNHRMRAKAEAAEKERDLKTRESARHESRHHWLTGAATLIEIGIALSTVAIITRRQPFWFSAIGLGVTGLALFAVAYLA